MLNRTKSEFIWLCNSQRNVCEWMREKLCYVQFYVCTKRHKIISCCCQCTFHRRHSRHTLITTSLLIDFRFSFCLSLVERGASDIHFFSSFICSYTRTAVVTRDDVISTVACLSHSLSRKWIRHMYMNVGMKCMVCNNKYGRINSYEFVSIQAR